MAKDGGDVTKQQSKTAVGLSKSREGGAVNLFLLIKCKNQKRHSSVIEKSFYFVYNIVALKKLLYIKGEWK